MTDASASLPKPKQSMTTPDPSPRGRWPTLPPPGGAGAGPGMYGALLRAGRVPQGAGAQAGGGGVLPGGPRARLAQPLAASGQERRRGGPSRGGRTRVGPRERGRQPLFSPPPPGLSERGSLAQKCLSPPMPPHYPLPPTPPPTITNPPHDRTRPVRLSVRAARDRRRFSRWSPPTRARMPRSRGCTSSSATSRRPFPAIRCEPQMQIRCRRGYARIDWL